MNLQKRTIQKKTILIADDENEIREDLALFLEYSDYQIIQADNGVKAYEYYLDNTLDLIITDIEMPKLNGLELVEKIRKKDNNIPILVISGYSDKDKLLRAIKLNLVDYMIKPFTRDSMLSTIQNIFITNARKLEDASFVIKEYNFSLSANVLLSDKKEYTLTSQQSKVLKLLLQNANVILSPIDIFYYLNPNFDTEYSNASIRNIIKRLRTILPEDSIESIYAEGYRLNIKK